MDSAFKNDPQVLIDNEDMLSAYFKGYCPIGWNSLVRQLFKDIRQVAKKHNYALPQVLRVKSKFGGLRFYLNNEQWDRNSSMGIEVRHLIAESEKKSFHICEITGQPGFRYVKDQWYATLSEEKGKELGYTKKILL